MFEFQDGDVILTYGSFHLDSIWDIPKELLMQVAYWGMRKYQKKKWEHIYNLDYKMTHVRIFLDGRIFEVTVPRAKWTTIKECNLWDKKFKVCRYPEKLNKKQMIKRANEICGSKYDVLDLVGFAASGLLGVFKDRINILHDRMRTYFVCSTGGAIILQQGGATFDCSTESVDPCFYWCKWPIVFEHNC